MTDATQASPPLVSPPKQIKDYLPETRTWIVAGLFFLTFDIFHMLRDNPALQDNKLFFGLATLIVGTFFGGAVGFYFGSSQGKNGVSATSIKVDASQ